MQKNVAGQKWIVFAFDRTDLTPKTGDAANITANLRLDGGGANAVDDTNPTELEDGYYVFDITQAECNAENIVIAPVSSTGDIQVIGVPGAVYTTPANFPDLSVVASTGRVDANMTAISDDTTAADNLELQYDATGLTGDTFPATQQQLGNIALTGATVSTPAKDAPNGFVITSGENEANDEDSTHALDDVTHDIEAVDDAGTEKIEVYYEFSIGGDGIPTGAAAHHQLDKGGGVAKNLTVWAYNWGTMTWDQIGTLNSGTSLETAAYTLFTSHVGTGGNIGLVRIRYLTGSVSLTATSKLLVDQIFLEYAIVSRTIGYADGAIWVDTNGFNTNTESHVDGTADNPVSTWAAALTLSGQLGITRFRIVNGSAITLTGNSDNYSIIGQEYTLAFGGQSTVALYVFGGSVSGVGTGSVLLEDCPVGDVTLPPSIMRRCYLFGDITNSSTGDWFINHCTSRVAGTSSPMFDFGAAVGNTNLNMRAWSGGIQLESMGNTGTDTASIEGWGQIIEGTCTGGTVVVRGNFTTSGITNLTLSDDARLTRSELVDDVLDEVNTGAAHNVTNSLGRQIREIREIGVYEGGAIWIDTVNGVAGTTNYENGTVDNPVDSIADARTLAVSLGLVRFKIAPGSSVTLAASFVNYEFNGNNWTLALGGQDISGSHIFGAEVFGTGVGASSVDFHDCTLGTCTLNQFHAMHCGLNGTITFGLAGDYLLHHCYSAIAGATTPIIDTGAAVGNVNLAMPDYSNGIEIRNLNNTGTDTFSISGVGQIIYAASSSGEVHQRGSWMVTNTGGVAITTDDNTTVLDDQAQAASTIVEGIATGTPTTTTMAASALTEDTNDHYNGRIIIWTSGVLKDQASDITDYDGTTKTFTFTAVTEAATAGDTFVIV